MKALQERTRDAEQHRLQADLDARVEVVFRRCPALCGFSVGERLVPVQSAEGDVREYELFVSAIDVYPAIGEGQSEQFFDEISRALAELLDERPEAAELLPGRTFARVLH